MDSESLLRIIVSFVTPRNLSDVFIETEGFLFIPILAYGYARGWWRRLPFYMDRFLGLDHLVKCPKCGEEYDAT